jgi:hypothetical protein
VSSAVPKAAFAAAAHPICSTYSTDVAFAEPHDGPKHDAVRKEFDPDGFENILAQQILSQATASLFGLADGPRGT